MSWNHLPTWDKNRPIYFKIGMIVSLAISNTVINYEILLPNYSDFVVTDSPMSLLLTEVKNHTEPTPSKQDVAFRKLQPLNPNIVTHDQPIVAKTETISDNTDIDVLPTNTHITRYSRTKCCPSGQKRCCQYTHNAHFRTNAIPDHL